MYIQDYIKQIDSAVDNSQLDELLNLSVDDVDLTVVNQLHIQERIQDKCVLINS